MSPVVVVMVFAGTFLAAALVVVVAVVLENRRPAPETAIPDDEFSGTPFLLRQPPVSSMPFWRRILDRLDVAQYLQQRIADAGLHWSLGRVTLAMLLLGAVGFALFFNASWAPSGLCVAGALAGGAIPYAVIHRKRSKRLRQIESQFPDTLDSLVRAMRAGHPLASAIQLLAVETPAPLGPEFRKLSDERGLGLAWGPILRNFAQRLPILEARLFAAAVIVQTRTGGKLTEVLEHLADTIRETASLRGEVRSISAQGRLTGWILTALPLVILAAMYITNPSYVGILFTHPTGKKLAWAAAGCLVLGHFVIQRIVDIKAPQ